MKRQRTDDLTGGTGDVNPQVLSQFVVQTGNDVTTQLTINLPIPRLPNSRGKNQVMEVLSVDWYHTSLPPAANSVTVGILTTSSTIFGTATAALQDSKLISATQRTTTFTTSGATVTMARDEDNLTDQAGHGTLVATDKLYLICYSGATGQANEVVARINYRFKDIGLSEYVGIVQSQQ